MNKSIVQLLALLTMCYAPAMSQSTSFTNARGVRVHGAASTGLNDSLSVGLVAYYPFNNNAHDSSGNGFDGTVVNATSVQDRFGNLNAAYDFNGMNSSIELGDILDTVFSAPIAKFTISGWARARTSGSSYTGSGFMIGKNGGGSFGPYQWSLSYVDGKVYGQVFFDTLAANYATRTCPMETNVWFHFAFVFDGSMGQSLRLALYINGQTLDVSTLQTVGEIGTTTVNSQQPLLIGGDFSTTAPGTNYFDGSIDDIRIYNRALNSAEIQALFHEGGYYPANPLVVQPTSLRPAQNALQVPPDSSISATFSSFINESTVTNNSACITGSISGKHSCSFSYNADTTTVTIAPRTSFSIGEVVTVTLTRGITSAAGDSLSRSYSWRFTVKTNPSLGHFLLSAGIPMGNGSSPHSVTALDVDGNGAVDLAVANYGLGTVVLLKNEGAGTFTQTSSVTVGRNPNTVISVDVNNDGSSDLVTTNNGAGTISVLKNDGTGSFTGTAITVGDHPISVTAADFNGDGSIDLAVANNFSNSVSILENDGHGSFILSSTVSVGWYPTSVTAADLNNDGFIDLAVTNSQSNSVSILLNNGDGAFTVSSSSSVGSIPWNVAAADLNGDGYLDLAVTNNESGTVSILLNDGSAYFSSASTLNLGGNPSSVTAVDVNGDGKIDLAIGNIASNTLSFWINNGSGSFTAGSLVNVDSYPCSATAADFNDDGRIELATANGIGNTISIVALPNSNATIVTSATILSFGFVPAGSSKNESLNIYNYGTDSSLVVSGITCSNPAFTVNRASLTIPPSGRDSILVTFLPTEMGLAFDDSLSLTSNDAKDPAARVYLRGSSGLGQPRVVFTLNAGGPFYAGISALGNNALYAIASGDAIYRLNVAGSVIYTLQVAGDVRSSSSIGFDSTVYIASSDRNLYAFSKDGNSLWPPLPTGGVLTATPTIDSASNRVYIGVSNNNFIAVNRSTGAVAWNYFADAQIRNSAVVTRDRKLIFATQKGTLYGFDLSNLILPASPNWKISLPDTAPSSIAIDDQGYVYVGTNSGLLLKILMQANSQPSIVWQVPLGQAITGSPVIDANGMLYVGSLDSKLYAIEIQSGDVKWTFSTKGAIRSTPAISDAGIIYVANDSGEVIAMDTAKDVLWYYRTGSAIVAPLLYYNSTLYAGTLGNQVIALYDGIDSIHTNSVSKTVGVTQFDAKPIWGTFQGNSQRTGLFFGSGTTGVENPVVSIPTDFELMQNYPNPFNPSTTLRYGLPMRSRVNIQVYDLLGQVVAVLVNSEQSAGWNEVVWNANVSSGLYFYRVEAVSVMDTSRRFVDVKKMILIK